MRTAVRIQLVLIFIALFLFAIRARADDYLITNRYDLNIIDVNKKMDGKDDMLCVAVAMSSAISSAFRKDQVFADQLFDEIIDANPKPVQPKVIWDWIMRSVDDGFSKYYSFDVWEMDVTHIKDRLIGALMEGWIVLPMFITEKRKGIDAGHIIVMYGYRIDESGNFYIIGCDGDDGVTKTLIWPVRKIDNKWYIVYSEDYKFELYGYAKIRVMVNK